jgi:TonB family protein
MSQNYFKKALDADPKFAEAFYRYGTALYRNGKVEGETGAQTFPPECKNSFKRYLQLQPGGPHAHQATAILAAMEQKVPQSYAPAPYWSEGQHPLIEQKQAETYLIKKVPPVYPLPAKEARIEGTVLIELMVAKNGEPHNMRVVSSPSVSLSLAALEALRQWRFQPMTSKGVAYDVFTSFAIKFTLPQ